MDLFKQGMKGPSRPAPAVPGFINRYSPVTNWNDDPFGADVFEPNPQFAQKKKPPPRPPPPKLNKQPDVLPKPSHFIRKPTVLSNLLSRKNKDMTTTTNKSESVNSSSVNQSTLISDFGNDIDPYRLFPKCDPKNTQTATLIDLSSPPSSPTFTTRSSSDGLSVDSFGSDATTSTNHHNQNNGNISQAESGFEDDFDLFLNTRKIPKDDTLDNFTMIDPFSPPAVIKPPVMKKAVLSKDVFKSGPTSGSVSAQKRPTIIRAKPARPKPPDNSALLKNTFGSNFPVISMNVNTTTPIQKIGSSFGDNFDAKPLSWDDSPSRSRESSPPMPSIPPPPPPAVVDDDLPVPEVNWDDDEDQEDVPEDEEPYAIALFDYFTDHPDDLCFSTNSRIKLIRRVDDDWLFGSLRTGTQGLFPSNYVEIKVPLPGEKLTNKEVIATALYSFEPDQPGDLRFNVGDKIKLLNKINEEWYLGECNGERGQFPVNYVQMS